MDAGTRPAGRQRWFGALFLVSGAALVVHILVGLPLWATIPGGLAFMAAFLWWVGAFTGVTIGPVVTAGVQVGAVATVTYDVSRVLVVELFDLAVRPFEAWPLFGRALVGAGAPAGVQLAAGVAFHVVNGLAFAIAYTAWFARRGVLTGIAWGLFLEAFMLGLYPGWLRLADYGPFLLVSLTGHVVYGAGARVLALRSDRR